MDADAAFAAAAEQLYALPAAAFVGGRNARAKQARGDGDRDLAARIAALQKPSASAALANLLVREHGDELDRVLELGPALRAAQEQADREALRSLGTKRRELLDGITRAVAERDGRPAGAAVLEELQQTLQAALVSEEVAEAVRSGRLVRGLTADGLDPVDLTNAVGGPGGAAPRRAPQPTASGGAADQASADLRRRLEDAEQEADEAARRADRAEREADRAARSVADAAARAEQREQAVADLRTRIEDLRRELAAAETELRSAREASSTAEGEADRATADADDARTAASDAARALDRLRTA